MENKKGKGWIITSVILLILLIGTTGYICYDKLLGKEDKDKPCDSVQTEEKVVETKNADYLEFNPSPYENEYESLHMYGDLYTSYIFSFKGDMYIANQNNTELQNWNQIFYAINRDNNMKNIYNLNVKESEISKIHLIEVPSSEAMSLVILIYKDGRVRTMNVAPNYSEETDKFTFENYKVKDIKEFICDTKNNNECTMKYKLLLQDGTEKEVE